MDSKKIISIFSFLFSFLLLCHESLARTPDFRPPQTSPSPSPAPGPSNEGCWVLLTSCRNGTLTACIDPSSTTSEQLLLLVRNDGESLLKVNVTVSHPKLVLQMQIPGHQINETNVSVNLGGNSFIQLDAGNLGCVIRIRSPATGAGIFDFATNINPTKGAYIVFLTGLIIVGGTWACCKRGKRGQHGNGIPYQELERGQPDSPSANNVETADGWEQNWDGDWDEPKSSAAVRRQTANGRLASRPPKKDGHENTWDD